MLMLVLLVAKLFCGVDKVTKACNHDNLNVFLPLLLWLLILDLCSLLITGHLSFASIFFQWGKLAVNNFRVPTLEKRSREFPSGILRDEGG